MSRRPPRVARWLLRLLPGPHGDFVVGDLEEEYTDTVRPERGAFRAGLWFWAQTLRTLAAFSRWKAAGSPPPAAPPLVREARHAFRGLRRRPGFSVVAVLTLAVGIGVASSVFSVADALIFRPVSGVADPDELVTVRFQDERDGSTTGFSLPTLKALAGAAPGAAFIAGYQPFLLQVAAEDIPARTAMGHLVTGDYFGLLGVHAARGRFFTRAEADGPDGPTLAVVSDAFWRGVLGADPRALGRSLRINGTRFTVVGVAPPDFRGLDHLSEQEIWLPGSAYVSLRHGEAVPSWRLSNRSARFFNHALARLAPGVAPDDLQRQLRAGMARLVEAYPDDNQAYRTKVPTVLTDFGLDPRSRATLGTTLTILSALALGILVVTCANVANLLVLQGLRRTGETALRRALGAARAHLALLHLAEALLLSLPAVVVGLGLALLLNEALWGIGLFPTGVAEHVAVDRRVFLFAAGTGVATAAVFGMLPFLLSARLDPQTCLKRVQRTSSPAATLLQGGLSVAQLALSLALVGGSLLLGRTVTNLSGIEVGFSADDVLAFEFDPGPQGYDRAATSDFQRNVLDAASRIAGVEGSAVSGFVPFGRIVMPLTLRDPADASKTVTPRVDWVTEDFFDVLRIPLVAGRAITREEALPPATPGPRATVLGRALAARLFGAPGRALGQTLEAEAFGDHYLLEVVGVAEDIVDGNLRGDRGTKLYVALPGSPQGWATLLIHTRRPLDEVTPDVARAVAGVDPNVPLSYAGSLANRVESATARERGLVRLSTLLAVLSLLLAGVGLYSVVAYAAAARRREFGIRIAVGASGVRITRLVFRRALALGMAGAVTGIVLTRAGARVLDSVLYGVEPTDPATLGAAAAFLLLITVAASLAPAWTATRVDPATTLRAE